MNYIAYYRVSTARQGASGLGLEAQQKTVEDYVKCQPDGHLVCAYQEIESGKNNKRIELDKAIEHAQLSGSTLIIAKLDRLSRNVQFIFALRDSKVKFLALDIPDMNTLTIGIFAVIAQHERELISSRTKAALDARKARGMKLGTPSNFTAEVRAKGAAAARQAALDNPRNAIARSLSLDLRKQGFSLRAIATKLNDFGLKTRNGKQFTASTIENLVKRA